jgi:hypothetical protein
VVQDLSVEAFLLNLKCEKGLNELVYCFGYQVLSSDFCSFEGTDFFRNFIIFADRSMPLLVGNCLVTRPYLVSAGAASGVVPAEGAGLSGAGQEGQGQAQGGGGRS